MTTLIVGSAAHLDLILHTKDRPTSSQFGTLLDSPGARGQWSEGGAAMTIAAAVSRQGASVALWHPLPTNKTPDFGLMPLMDMGVDVSRCPSYDGSPVCSTIVYGPDWRMGWSAPPVQQHVKIAESILDDVSHVVIAPVWGAWVDDILKRAAARSIPCSLVGFSDPRASRIKWKSIIVDVEQAMALAGAAADEWIVTDGAKGATITCAEGRFAIAAVPVKVVDQTGAGDTFAGTYLGARAVGRDHATAGRRAAVVAARVCETWGSRPPEDFFHSNPNSEM